MGRLHLVFVRAGRHRRSAAQTQTGNQANLPSGGDMKTAVAVVAILAALLAMIRMPVEDSTKETMALIDASRNAHLRLFR